MNPILVTFAILAALAVYCVTIGTTWVSTWIILGAMIIATILLAINAYRNS